MSRRDEVIVGVVLSGSTTVAARVQLTLEGERRVREGTIVLIKDRRSSARILARVESIEPVSEAHEAGDLWTELRRLGRLPAAVEEGFRTYYVAETSIIGIAAGGGSIAEPDFPPTPGSPVLMPSGDQLAALLGFSDRPGIVEFGELIGYRGVGLPLDVENITMHLGVFGETGSGKSYAVGYLIEKLATVPLGGGLYGALPALVVDANGDYLDYYAEYSQGKRVGKYELVTRFVFPNSRARYNPYTEPIVIDLEGFTAREIAEFIMTYRAGGVELNELQVSALERAIKELEEVYTKTELFLDKVGALRQALEDLVSEKIVHHQTARAVMSAVEKFRADVVEGLRLVSKRPTLNEGFVDRITEKPALTILDFSAEGAPGVPLPIKQLVVAYLARLLYRKFTEYKMSGKDRYMVLVLEEAQNYAPNPRTYPVPWSLARDYLALIATQGRKFGICLVLVSQRPAFVDPVVLSMLNTMIVFRLAPEDVSFILRASGGLPRVLESRLPRLPRGTAVVMGQMNALGQPVMIRVGRRAVSHVMGRTKVVEYLRGTARR
ncbi:MAG: ATP-binding protein [Thermoproteota archaeon]